MKNKSKVFNLSSISIIMCDCLQAVIMIFFDLFVVANILEYGSDNFSLNFINIMLFYLLEYVTIGLSYWLSGYFLKKYNKSIFVSIGSILLTACVLVVYFLNSKGLLYNWLPLVGFAYGLSWAFFSSGFHNLTSETISSKHQVKFFAVKRVAYQLTYIIFPIALGYFVDYLNFSWLALIMIILGVALIVFSFLIRPKIHYEMSFNIPQFMKYLREHKEETKPLRLTYWQNFFRGTTNDCIGIIITVLTFTALQSNSMLGTLQSAFTVASLISMFIFLKFYRKKRAKNFIIPIITLISLATVGVIASTGSNAVFIIIFYAVYTVLHVIMVSISDSRRSSVARTLSLHSHILENTAMLEFHLALGRATMSSIILWAGVIDYFIGNNSRIFLLIALGIEIIMYVMFGLVTMKLEKSLVAQDEAFVQAHQGETFEKAEE